MNRDYEETENFLKQADLPDFESEEFRRDLRGRAVELSQRRKKMGARIIKRKTIMIAAALLVTLAAAAVAGVAVREFYFVGETSDGEELMFIQAKDGDEMTMRVTAPKEATASKSMDQIAGEWDEIERLRRQNKRKLTGVLDTWTNGYFERSYSYEYELSSGEKREILGEPGPQMAEETDLEELERLKAKGEGELFRLVGIETEGEKKEAVLYKYRLSDGRDVWWLWSEREVIEKYDVLYNVGKTEFVETVRRTHEGQEVAVDIYRTIGTDGKVHTLWEGVAFPQKWLTVRSIMEVSRLLEEGAAEDLGVEEKIVEGKKFKFIKKRYMLSGGTEYIQANGFLVE